MQNKLIGDNLLSNCQKNKTVSRSKTKESEKSLADNQTNTFPPLLNYLATVYLEKVSELS